MHEYLKRIHLVERMSNIWRRARHNAFAHKIAAEDAKENATKMYKKEMFLSFGSICFVILTYLISSVTFEFLGFITNTTVGLLTTICSVFCSLAGIYFGVLSGYLKYDTQHAEHIASLGSYQHIAQKARMAKWKNIPYEQLEREFLWMEESFQLLKARGREPSDDQFDRGEAVFNKIKDNKRLKGIQSYYKNNDSNASERRWSMCRRSVIKSSHRLSSNKSRVVKLSKSKLKKKS